MGQSAPTTTDAFATFQQRYAGFRDELHVEEQRWFDELVCGARRHSAAINRRPHLDFERPVMLAMLMEAMRHLDEAHERDDQLRHELRQLQQELADAGVVARRPSPAVEHRIGQTRLQDHEATVSA